MLFQTNLCFAAFLKFPPPYEAAAYAMAGVLGLSVLGLLWQV